MKQDGDRKRGGRKAGSARGAAARGAGSRVVPANGRPRRRATLDPALAARIRFVGLDVDGVMTDGGIYLGDVAGAAHEFKRYDIQDGLGVYLMRQAGLVVGVLTGRVSQSVELRARELRADELYQDAHARKLPGLLEMLDRRRISLAATAFVGDDFPDLAILRIVGLPVAVGNAIPEVRRVAALQLSRSGGHGAVREFAELLLRARGQWDDVVEQYVAGTTSAIVVRS